MGKFIRRCRALENQGVGLFVILVLTLASSLTACPMCKDSTVETDNKPAVTASAGVDFNKSIYVMLGGFATLVGITGRVMYKAVRSGD